MTVGYVSRCRAARWGVVTAALIAAAATAAGCGGKSANKADPFGEAKVGDVVVVDGTLSLRGSTPFPFVMLELGDGGVVVIQSSTLQKELESLAGMKVSIEGKLLPAIDDESPRVDAYSYSLLALPTGEVPIVGTLRLENGQCLLKTEDAKLYWIRGDFEYVLKGYDGARVWVVGSAKGAYLETPEGSIPLQVTGYGVLSSP